MAKEMGYEGPVETAIMYELDDEETLYQYGSMSTFHGSRVISAPSPRVRDDPPPAQEEPAPLTRYYPAQEEDDPAVWGYILKEKE